MTVIAQNAEITEKVSKIPQKFPAFWNCLNHGIRLPLPMGICHGSCAPSKIRDAISM
jgi:hypothetical protein